MATNKPGTSAISRKIMRLGILILLAIAVYCGAWFFAANSLQKSLLAFFGGENPAEVNISCEDTAVRGFPFRIGLFCSRVGLDDRFHGLSASFGALRSAAQIYAPGHVVWELDGPGEVRSALGFSAALQWQALRSSVNSGLSGVDRTSLEATGAKATLTAMTTGQTFDTASEHLEAHARRNGDDLDIALLIRNGIFRLAGGAPVMPPVSTTVDLTLAGKAKYLDMQGDRGEGLYGSSGEIRRIAIDLGGGRVLTANGPFSVGTDGQISGKLRLEMEGIDGWKDTLVTAFPDAADNIKSGTKILKALFSGKQNGGVDLKIENGVIILGGFIPIGVLPPI